MELFAIIFGAILMVASIGFSIYKLVIMIKDYKEKNPNQNQKKDLLITAISTIASGIAGFSIILGYLYLKERPVLPGHIVEIVLGSLIFFPSLFWFIYTLTLKHLKLDFADEPKKWVKWTNVASVFASIIFFIVMMDGFGYYITYPFPNQIVIGGSGGFVDINNSHTTSSTGGLSIAFYALFILSGAVLVYFYCDHRFYKITGRHGELESVFLTAFPAGIIGARLWYCYVLEWDTYSTWDGVWKAYNNPFAIWTGGLAIMGGAILGIVVGVLWVVFMKKEIKIRQAIDIIVPTILIAQAVGRWGNFFNSEVYGSALLTMQEGFWIPSFIKFNMIPSVLKDHTSFVPYKDLTSTTLFHVPLFYVEAITNLGGYYFIRYLFEKQLLFKGIAKASNAIAVKTKHGALSEKTYNTIATAFPKGGCAGMYLIWYGFTRLFLEPLRDSKDYYAASVDSSVLLIGLGVAVIAMFAIYQYVIEPKHPFWPQRAIAGEKKLKLLLLKDQKAREEKAAKKASKIPETKGIPSNEDLKKNNEDSSKESDE